MRDELSPMASFTINTNYGITVHRGPPQGHGYLSREISTERNPSDGLSGLDLAKSRDPAKQTWQTPPPPKRH